MNSRLLVVVSLALSTLNAKAIAQETGPRDCFWQFQGDPVVLNVAYPDFAARYWISAFALPPGAALEIKGQYPHARYMSFNLYDVGAAEVDGLADVLIAPDAGSSNPFLPGARRDVTDRNYTVQIKVGPQPAEREPNTLYLTLDGTVTLKPVTGAETPFPVGLMLLRIYVPDEGRDLTGDVRLPDVALVMPGGVRIEGPDACDLLGTTAPDILLPLMHSVTPPALPASTAGVEDPLVWQKFTNILESLGISLPDAIRTIVPQNGGFFSNEDNAYVRAAWDTGSGDLIALFGKAPTYPETYSGNPVMQAAQVRYWSVCQNDLLTGTRAVSCVPDYRVPLTTDGDMLVVVSGPAKRPANATAECRVAWLPSGPNPRGMLLIRNMLPAADFIQSIQAVVDFENPGETMGSYLPVGKHMSTEDFETLGCPVTSRAVVDLLRSAGVEVPDGLSAAETTALRSSRSHVGSLEVGLLLALGLAGLRGARRRRPTAVA